MRKLENEFYESDAAHHDCRLVEMGNVATARFRRLQPELSSEAIEALA